MALKKIDKTSAVPLYLQVAEGIRELIDSKEFKQGEPIPPENELMEIFGVSRNTVRQAISRLISMGYLYIEKGKGTFVSKVIFNHPSDRLLGFSEEMKSSGFDPVSKILHIGVENATREVAEELLIKAGDSVYRLKRIRFSNGLPVSIEEAFIKYENFKGLLDNFDERSSLYATFVEKFGVQPFYAEETVEASLVKSDEISLLGIKEGAPVFRIRRRTFDRSGEILEFVRSVYRGDIYRINLHLRRIV
ncbi:GntR family transcriptional regulator [Caldisericum exile]|uniref:GntR family transcriptional regulator n=1 Tax=Caldisericum exile (strain DSM 21853 / NBRC 104410 / AZM16c01) TaxID=511051 RepID=A0A7U6JFG5_CALEA|nr:GntR family transcriptional regulator [Caldisericum exile]BAL80419.1 GntR family transcriptional regulator [Caldisericum exile AZM16c01]